METGGATRSAPALGVRGGDPVILPTVGRFRHVQGRRIDRHP